MQLALLGCYAILAVISITLIYLIAGLNTTTAIARESFETLLYLNSPLNPALYFWRIRDVRRQVTQARCLCRSRAGFITLVNMENIWGEV